MGFYGNISNVNKSTFQFDKIYPNRYEMDTHASDDGIFIGRYVLVDYDKEASSTTIAKWISDLSEEEGEAVSINISDKILVPGYRRMVYNENNDVYEVTGEFYAGIPFYDATAQYITGIQIYSQNNIDNGVYLICVGNIKEKEVNKGTIEFPDIVIEYQLDLNIANTLYLVSYEEDEVIFTELSDVAPNLSSSNYTINHIIDAKYFENQGRGWDSTVWQKTYKDGNIAYVMIAELNSVVPTFDIVVDAPTDPLIKPYWDAKDSSNVYYKLHLQPQFGFKIRDKDGKTSWDKDKQEFGEGEEYPGDDETKAIYWFEDGFNKYYDKEPEQEDNEILLELTGDSGNYYYDPAIIGSKRHVRPDTYELSVLLPKLGQSISDIWDIIYGKGSVYDTLGNVLWDKGGEINSWTTAKPDTLIRNTNIEWNTRNGIRAYWKQENDGHTENSTDENIEDNIYNPTFGYNKAALNTLAGTINTVHDLMGMIIIEKNIADVDNFDASELDPHNIYFNKANNKYYFKDKKYFTKTEGTGISKDTLINPSTLDEFYRIHTLAADNYDNLYKDLDGGLKEFQFNNYYKVRDNEELLEEEVYGIIGSKSAKEFTEEISSLQGENIYEKLVDNAGKQWYVKRNTENLRFEGNEYVTLRITQTAAQAYYMPGKFYLLKKNCENAIEKGRWENSALNSPNDVDFDSITICYESTPQEAIANVGINSDNEEYIGYVFISGVEQDSSASSFIIQDLNIAESEFQEVFIDDIHFAERNGKLYYSAFGENTELLNITPITKQETIYDEATEQDITVEKTGYRYKASRYIDANYAIREGENENSPLMTLQEWVEYCIEEDIEESELNLIWTPNFQKVYINKVYSLANANAVLGPGKEGGIKMLQESGGTEYYVPGIWRDKTGNAEDFRQIFYADITANNGQGSGDIAGQPWYSLIETPIAIFYNITQSNYFNDNDNWIRETASVLTSSTTKQYYTLNNWETKNLFIPNTYYYKDNGEFKLAQQFSDLNNVDNYYKCPSDTVTYKWGLTEIPRLGDEINTLHGLILKVNKILLEGNELTRDRSTIQGALNSLNDILDKFNLITANSVLMTNANAKIYSGQIVTNTNNNLLAINRTGEGNNQNLSITHKVIDSTANNYRNEVSLTDTNSNVISWLKDFTTDAGGHITQKNHVSLTLEGDDYITPAIINIDNNNSINKIKFNISGLLPIGENTDTDQNTTYFGLKNSLVGQIGELSTAFDNNTAELEARMDELGELFNTLLQTEVATQVKTAVDNAVNSTTIQSNFWGVQINGNTGSVSINASTIDSDRFDRYTLIPLSNETNDTPKHLIYGFGQVKDNYTVINEGNTAGGVQIHKSGLYRIQGAIVVGLKAGVEIFKGSILKTSQSGSGSTFESFDRLNSATETFESVGTETCILSIPSKLVYINQDDVIYLAAQMLRSSGNDSINVLANNPQTYILIEKVENALLEMSYQYTYSVKDTRLPETSVPSTGVANSILNTLPSPGRYSGITYLRDLKYPENTEFEDTIESQQGVWRFQGWTYNEIPITDSEPVNIESSAGTVIKGNWEFVNKYTISYEYVSDSEGINIPNSNVPDSFAPPANTYIIDGEGELSDVYPAKWSTNTIVNGEYSTGTWILREENPWTTINNEPINENILQNINENITVYGHWYFDELSYHRVSYQYANDESTPFTAEILPNSEKIYLINGQYTAIMPILVKDKIYIDDNCYEFEGWYLNDIQYSQGAAVVIEEDCEFIGKWSVRNRESYTIEASNYPDEAAFVPAGAWQTYDDIIESMQLLPLDTIEYTEGSDLTEFITSLDNYPLQRKVQVENLGFWKFVKWGDNDGLPTVMPSENLTINCHWAFISDYIEEWYVSEGAEGTHYDTQMLTALDSKLASMTEDSEYYDIEDIITIKWPARTYVTWTRAGGTTVSSYCIASNIYLEDVNQNRIKIEENNQLFEIINDMITFKITNDMITVDNDKKKLKIIIIWQIDENQRSYPASISLDMNNITIEEKQSVTLTATITPDSDIAMEQEEKIVEWSSSNEDVAVVATNGTVIAKSPGTTIITATTVNNFTAICEVTVTTASDQITYVSYVLTDHLEPDKDYLIANANNNIAYILSGEISSNNNLRAYAVLVEDNKISIEQSLENQVIFTYVLENNNNLLAKLRNNNQYLCGWPFGLQDSYSQNINPWYYQNNKLWIYPAASENDNGYSTSSSGLNYKRYLINRVSIDNGSEFYSTGTTQPISTTNMPAMYIYVRDESSSE